MVWGKVFIAEINCFTAECRAVAKYFLYKETSNIKKRKSTKKFLPFQSKRNTTPLRERIQSEILCRYHVKTFINIISLTKLQ